MNTPFEEYHAAMCEGAGGAWLCEEEYALLQHYWDELVKNYNPLVVELYGPHADPGIGKLYDGSPDLLEAKLPEAIQLLNKLAPISGTIVDIFYARAHTNAPFEDPSDPRNNDYYKGEDQLRSWMSACNRYQALYNAAWHEV